MTVRPLAAIAFETAPIPAPDIGRWGRLEFISKDLLVVDDAYQRAVDRSGRANIRKMIEQFHCGCFAPLFVAPRPGGLFAVMDGQHHGIAAMMHPAVDTVPCYVLNCTAAEEAHVFATVNHVRTRVTPQHLFHARCAAGDVSALTARRAADAAGVEILRYPVAAKLMQPRQTLAAGTIEACVTRYGEAATTAALTAIAGGREGGKGLLRAAVIEALSELLYQNPVWLADAAHVTAALRLTPGLAGLYAQALKDAAQQEGGVRFHVGRLVEACLKRHLGAGGSEKGRRATLEALRRQEALSAKRADKTSRAKPKASVAEQERLAESAARERAVIQAASRRAPAKVTNTRPVEQAAISDFIAKRGVRRFEDAATGDLRTQVEWLQRQGVNIERSHWSPRDEKIAKWKLNGKTVDIDTVRAAIDAKRQELGLPAIYTRGAA